MTYVPPTDNPSPEKLAEFEKTDPARALVEYANRNQVADVQRMLDNGVNPDTRVLFDIGFEKIAETALCTAAANGHVDVAKALIAGGASLEFTSEVEFTPLLNAAAASQPDMVRFLVNAGADMAAREESFGQTPLHKAARLGFMPCVVALVELGADRGVYDNAGLRPQDMICLQAGGKPEAREKVREEILEVFLRAELRDAVAAQRYADELANAPVLQRNLKPLKPVRFGRG
ncbi:MAG: ankyrin repeat domain-containing protein [Micavibrio sp.]|nr:ankyrin repeat domain-containing protein [Micavibrio sp.]